MSIIALFGAKSAGKTTVANYLCRHHGYHCLSFADPMRWMLQNLGITRTALDNDKESSPAVLGDKTINYALKTLGTEWGRQLINEDIWVEVLRQRLSFYPNIVIDDLRFNNEFDMLQAYNACFVYIAAPKAENQEDHTHISNLIWRSWANGERKHKKIENLSSFADLQTQVTTLVESLK